MEYDGGEAAAVWSHSEEAVDVASLWGGTDGSAYTARSFGERAVSEAAGGLVLQLENSYRCRHVGWSRSAPHFQLQLHNEASITKRQSQAFVACTCKSCTRSGRTTMRRYVVFALAQFRSIYHAGCRSSATKIQLRRVRWMIRVFGIWAATQCWCPNVAPNTLTLCR